jgi:hypothetical protein
MSWRVVRRHYREDAASRVRWTPPAPRPAPSKEKMGRTAEGQSAAVSHSFVQELPAILAQIPPSGQVDE